MKLSYSYKLGLKSFVLFTSLTLNGFAYAQGDKTGGGGDILSCQEDGRTNYYLLDMHEAKLKGQRINLGPANLSLKEKIIFARERYAEIDPTRADLYAAEALKMLQDIEAREQGQSAPNNLVALIPQELKDIDDADETFTFSENCKKFQLVRQEKPFAPRDPFYTIDQIQWSRLDSDQKVATLYHEAIYKEMRQNGAYLSKGARSLNGMIMSGVIQNLKSGEYRNFILSQKLKSYRYLGLFETDQGVNIGNDGEIESISGEYPLIFGTLSQLKVKDPQFSKNGASQAQFEFTAQSQSTFDRKDGKITVSRDGEIQGGTLEYVNENLISLRNATKKNDGGFVHITFNQEGNILSLNETGFYMGNITQPESESLEAILACSRKLVQKQKLVSEATAILTQARRAIPSHDQAALTQSLQNCKDIENGKTVSLSTAMDPVSQKIVEQFNQPKAEFCKGFGFSAKAAVGKVGIFGISCQFNDGSRRFYFGPTLGIYVGIVGDFRIGPVTLLNNQPGVSIGKGGLTSVRKKTCVETKHFQQECDNQVITWLFKGTDSYVSRKLREKESDSVLGMNDNFSSLEEGRQVGIGIFAGGGYTDTSTGLKLFRQKDRWNELIHQVSSQILIQK